ncbi:hypothetical protein OG607_06845 [Streptomyces sp. NBC_01537]
MSVPSQDQDQEHDQDFELLQRPPAEVRYAGELAVLRENDRDHRPPGWQLSLRAARRFVIGDEDAGISRKFVGNPSLVDRALVTS